MGNVLRGPSGNGFDWHSTADQAAKGVDLTGKTAIVTGANSGMGKESARVLAQHGCYVVFTSRDMVKGEEAMVDMVKAGAPSENLKLMQLDLASFESVKKFAEEFKALDRPLHILMNNAGVMMCPYAQTKDGFEMQIGTNHLGHFLLTHLLMDSIRKAGPGARIVNTSSLAHTFTKRETVPATVDEFTAEWLKTPEAKYSKIAAYGRSKLANVWFTKELHRRFASEGIVSITLHPGVVSTNLGRHMGPQFITNAMKWFNNLIVKSVEQGAATQVFAAVNPIAAAFGGQYLDCCNVVEPTEQAKNEQYAKTCWEASERACGITW